MSTKALKRGYAYVFADIHNVDPRTKVLNATITLNAIPIRTASGLYHTSVEANPEIRNDSFRTLLNHQDGPHYQPRNIRSAPPSSRPCACNHRSDSYRRELEARAASARAEANYYDRYMQLSSNVAQKHPNPGRPREHIGRIGGNWRHIREVLGYTGTQVCFVDGLVSLYDKEQAARAGPQRGGAAWRSRLAGPTGYSANLQGHELTGQAPKGPAYELDHFNTSRGGDSKYKGFYTLRQ